MSPNPFGRGSSVCSNTPYWITDELDLRDRSEEDDCARLFDTMDDVESGVGFEVVADDGIDTHLIRYQIRHGYADCDAESRELQVIVGRSLDDSLGAIDVRDLKPQRRHEALLEISGEPGAGEGFVLVNDHNPKPLYHQFETEAGSEFRRSVPPA